MSTNRKEGRLFPVVRTAGVFCILSAMASALLCGCASTGTSQTESQLSAAGFRTMTPAEAERQANFSATSAYELQRHDVNGKVLYTYYDQRADTVYVGSEQDYKKYHQLLQKQSLANENLQASHMNQDLGVNGPNSWRLPARPPY